MDRMFTKICMAIAVAGSTAACKSLEPPPPPTTVALESRSGSAVTGTLSLVQKPDGVRVSGEVRGFAPGSLHGFHVHEKGDCSAPDATSAGPHFNPTGAPHGQAGAGPHHAGDMPNITADPKGIAQVDILLAGATLDAGPGSIRGRAVVVHRNPDDYTTQPAGNAGPRDACGVIP
jgi:Cu-Zn family superoxide dismutase